MTNLTQYEEGCSPCAIQRKYSLTYEQGYELAERLKKTQELELGLRKENAQLKELLKQSRVYVLIDTEDYEVRTVSKSDREAAKKLLSQIDEVLK